MSDETMNQLNFLTTPPSRRPTYRRTNGAVKKVAPQPTVKQQLVLKACTVIQSQITEIAAAHKSIDARLRVLESLETRRRNG